MIPSFIRLAATLLLGVVFSRIAPAAEEYAVFKSGDQGRSWSRAGAGLPGTSRINAFGSVGEVWFAGTDTGIFLSKDEGRNWRVAVGGSELPGRVLSFATLGRKAFAGTERRGLWVSKDRGESWFPNEIFPSKKVRCLLTDGDKLYAGTDSDGVFVSTNGGESWSALSREFPPQAQVFALAGVEGRLFAGLYSKGLYGWNESEGRWEKVGSVTPLALATVGGTLVAGHNPGGLHRSGDSGVSWLKGTSGETTEGGVGSSDDDGALPPEAPVWELGAGGERVFAGAGAGVYFSEDRGRTWIRARGGMPAESPGIAFLVKGDQVLVATVARTRD